MAFLLAHVGVSIGYHRYFSHRSFSVSAPGKWLLATLGTLTLQGSPLYWAAQHRLHHEFCEEEGDPHSPQGGVLGFVHAHGGFLTGLTGRTIDENPYYNMGVVRDLASDPDLAALGRMPFGAVFPAAVMLGTPLLTCCLFGPFATLWYLHVPQLLAWHATLSVNSATHSFGYARLDPEAAPPPCHARNVPWLWGALLGEAWHANHHAAPQLASMERQWWEVDIQFHILLLAERAGLVWDVQRAPPLSEGVAGASGRGMVAQMVAPPLLLSLPWAASRFAADPSRDRRAREGMPKATKAE